MLKESKFWKWPFIWIYFGILTVEILGVLNTEVVGETQEKFIWNKVIAIIYLPFHFFSGIYIDPFLIFFINPLIWLIVMLSLSRAFLTVVKFLKKT